MVSRAAFVGSLLLAFGAPPSPVAPNPPTITTSPTVTTTYNTAKAIPLTANGVGKVSYKFTQPMYGKVSGTAPKLTYTPNPTYFGPDSFELTASNKGGSAEETVMITVLPPPPKALDKSEPVSVQFNTPKDIALEAKGTGPLTFTIVTPPQCGNVTVSGAAARYVPTDQCAGNDTFAFKANNSPDAASESADSNVATVNINVEQKPIPGTVSSNNVSQPVTTAPGAILPATKTNLLDQYPWLLSAISTLLALIAIVWAIALHVKAKSLRLQMVKEQGEASRRIGELEAGLTALERPAAQSGREVSQSRLNPSRTEQSLGTVARADQSAQPLKPRKPSELPDRGVGVQTRPTFPSADRTATESEPGGTLRPNAPSAAPPVASVLPFRQQAAANVAPSAPPAPDPRLKSGNVCADYNRARTMGHEGQEWFLTNYNCVGLSCVNLTDRRANSTAELRFVDAARGVFLRVKHEGEVLLLPALDKEFEAARPSLEGAFVYRDDSDASTQLMRPGLLRRSGAEWILQQDGEIGRG